MMTQRHFLYLLLLPIGLLLASCSTGDDDQWKEYANWRELNEQWLNEQALSRLPDGKLEYTRVVPVWNENAYILMKWYNDTALTMGNLRPLYTSTVDVKYIGRLYDGAPFDSSFVNTTFGDSIYRVQPSAVIEGWTIALERMHVGDSVQVLIPYQSAYGTSAVGNPGSKNYIPPYSALQFDIKLVDIPGEYIRP